MSIKGCFRPARWHFVIVTIITLTSLAANGQAPTGTQNPCATGSATLPGQSGQTFSSPFDVLMKASTGSNCTLTELRLYVDNKTYQSVAVNQPGSGGYDFKPVDLPDGYHNLVGVAWNQDGYAFHTQEYFSVFVANEDQTVYINSPADNQTVTDPTVHFDVRTRWDADHQPNSTSQVVHLRVYVDNQDIYDYNGDQVDFYKNFTSGWHYMVAIAWNGAGSYIKNSSTFNVK